MVRLAIVGIGGYGWELVRHIQSAARHGRCRLVAAADTRLKDFAERAKRLSDQGVELFDDAPRMFTALRGRCDGAYIATGIGSHAILTVAAAEAGLHVHLEKPPAATVQDVDLMLDALRRAGRMCLVGFQAAHAADILFLKDRVASGRLGAVDSLACRAGWPRTRAYYSRNDWAGRLRGGDNWVLDGPATNALAHQVTNMLLVASPRAGRLATPTAVRAELYAAGDIDSHDTAAIEIRTAEGPRAYFLASHCSDKTFGPVIEVSAERGTAEWHSSKGLTIRYEDGSQETCPHDSQMHAKMVENFLDAVESGDASRLRCPLEEARKMVLALDGAYESSGRIHRIEGERARRADEGTDKARTVVDGLDGLLVESARGRVLFSDLPAAPEWAVRTKAYELAAYAGFPQRFGRA
jgi:predicted dehydrogenase